MCTKKFNFKNKPMKPYPFLLILFSCLLTAQNRDSFADSLQTQMRLPYTLTISEDPISARKTFFAQRALVEDYFHYVTQQNPAWYLRYFNLNTLGRKGWSSHWELYDNRFLTWMEWSNSLFLRVASFTWNIPFAVSNRFSLLNARNVSALALFDFWRQSENIYVANTQRFLAQQQQGDSFFEDNLLFNTQSSARVERTHNREGKSSKRKTYPRSKPGVKSLKNVLQQLRVSGVVDERVKQRAPQREITNSGAAAASFRSSAIPMAPRKDFTANTYPLNAAGNYALPRVSAPQRTLVQDGGSGYSPPPSSGNTSVKAVVKQ
jgi:hypothetical protein